MEFTESTISQLKEECQNKILNEIESSTRFCNNNLKVDRIDHKIFDFYMDVHYKIEVRTHIETEKGTAKNIEKEDFFTLHNIEFNNEIEKQKREEENNNDIRETLINLIKSGEYGKDKTEFLIHENPRKLYYKYSCETCLGSGKVKCKKCNGEGKVKCTSCGGKGYKDETKTKKTIIGYSEGSYRESPRVPIEKTTYETVRRTCSSCSGGKIKCETCKGTGKIECCDCNGTGYFTDVATTKVYIIPKYEGKYSDDIQEYVKDIVENIHGESNILNICDIQLDEIIQESSEILFKYKVKLLSFEAFMEINNMNISWILYSNKKLLIYDAGDIFDVLLNEDLKNISDIKFIDYLNPFFRSKAKKNLMIIMESEVYQELLGANIENPKASVNQLKIKIEQKLSLDHINQSLNSISKTLCIVNIWGIIKLMIFTLMACIALFYLILKIEGRGGANFDNFDIKIKNIIIIIYGFMLSLIGFLAFKAIEKKYLTSIGKEILYKWSVLTKKITMSSFFIVIMGILNAIIIFWLRSNYHEMLINL